eukprot:GILI01014618.1.p1 GENE.GILI01014618.1~~GILI01014618.1.p1  ORF type:complete len:313 (-),score=4.11 GILI01014618.1:1013-1951(-)
MKSGEIHSLPLVLFFVLLQTLSAVVYKLAQGPDGSYSFNPSSTVLISEILKFLIAFIFLQSTDSSWKCSILSVPPHLILKLSLPSFLYAVINNLLFNLYQLVDVGTLTTLRSGSAFISALFMKIVLGKQFSLIQIGCLTLEVIGSILTQIDPCSAIPLYPFSSYAIVMFSFSLSAFAGVWNEKTLKHESASMHLQNCIMYSAGILFNFAFIITSGQESSSVLSVSSYSPLILIILQAFTGTAVAAVIKYADNVVKTFASGLSLVIISVLNCVLFGQPFGIISVLGMLVLLIAIFMYLQDSNREAQSSKVLPS